MVGRGNAVVLFGLVPIHSGCLQAVTRRFNVLTVCLFRSVLICRTLTTVTSRSNAGNHTLLRFCDDRTYRPQLSGICQHLVDLF
jgi:hypothetical protein